MKRLQSLLAACLLVAVVLTAPAAAYHQPALNLGLTSFVDGGPPAGPGFYFTEYFQYYTANELPDLPIPDPDLDVWVSLNQFIYQSNQELLLGGKWGLDVIVPLVCIDAEPGMFLPDNGGGLGDILVGPYLQWEPIMSERGPVFMHRIEFQMIFPTGKYDDDKLLNPGSNLFSFNPYWAATYFFTPKLTASWRLHYLWNGENDEPFIGLPGGPEEIQPGEVFHANFAVSYEAIPKKLRVGLNGYYLDQLSDTEYDIPGVGTEEIDEDEKVCAFGPGFLWSFSQNDHLFFNAYFETDADYRPEGERFVLRYVHHF